LRDYGGQVPPAYANLLRQGYGGQEASSRQASRKGQSEKQKAHSLCENRLKFESRILLKIRPHRNLPHYTRKATGLQFKAFKYYNAAHPRKCPMFLKKGFEGEKGLRYKEFRRNRL
jgi:hypothetical protein